MKNNQENQTFNTLVTDIQAATLEADGVSELDYRSLSFPKDERPNPAYMHGSISSTDMETLREMQGSTVIQIPPELIGIEARKLWQRMRINAMLGIPPQTPFEWLIKAVRCELCKSKSGKKINISAVHAGVFYAIARTHGIKIATPERGMALHLRIRYETFLIIRKLAVGLITENNIRLRMPDWAESEWE